MISKMKQKTKKVFLGTKILSLVIEKVTKKKERKQAKTGMANETKKNPFGLTLGGQCGDKLTAIFQRFSKFLALFICMVLLCNGSHYLVKPYSQPRITTDMFMGLFIGNLWFLHEFLDKSLKTFRFIIDFGMMCYMFVLGIEMNPYVLFKKPSQDAIVAYAGIFFPLIIACSIIPFLDYSADNKIEFGLALCTALSSTASPVLTRLITSLKIGKSDIGRLVIGAGMHSDFICTLILSIGYIAMPFPSYNLKGFEEENRHKRSIEMGCALLIQTVFTANVSPIFMKWVNNENPEGRPMKASHLILSIAFMALVCGWAPAYGYSPILSAFMTGICLPREGRVSKWVISKINYMLTTIFCPIFFLWMGFEANFREFKVGQLAPWARLLLVFVIAVVGKVVGVIISGAILGFHWPESVAIGLLLITKGHYQIYMAVAAKQCGATTTTSIGMVIAILFTVLHAPSVVARIIKRARKRVPIHRMALQLLDPSDELNILLCVHGLQNVPAAINFMEISRGAVKPGIMVYVTEMIELTDQIAATLKQVEGADTMTVNDKEVLEMREQITASVQSYAQENSDGITVRRMLALSTFSSMPQDLCTLAEDFMIALIILPFHKSQRGDGTLDSGNSGFRYVNRKVMRNAPCSVGIFVDRGLGTIEKISRSYVSLNVAVIFIGGKDDREALAYTGRVARHPGVKLTVIRFLVDSSSDYTSRIAGYRVNNSEQEEEMRRDDECFAHFYERHVAAGHLSYMEKHLANSAETYTTLRSFDGQYALIIVGRGGGVNSILTMGMNDWQQCPELGPIGDVLSGPAFLAKTSVLIIQQHNLKGELDGLDDDFSVM
ncbi:Cation/H(+) antiporter like [Quillaja saponaria]|uniref:Cation/H(+) antiporter like n=1 Tax=Quillaja saponaria TaxID=32244 RepID=A0AAD7VNX9_QUISA|nr:Cation/H(+) antiporter like [Quillaja saponaria]